MAFNCIETSAQDGIYTILLNRPDRMNAFTVEMGNELVAALDEADGDDAVRAVVLSGNGRAFCAGMDLSTSGNVFGLDETVDASGPDMERNRDEGGKVVLRMYRMKKPLIGAINGASVGVGSTMQLPLDVRIASPYAKFGFVFSQRGITLESCASWFLPRLVGVQKALEWSFKGNVFGADEALAAGLISEIVDADELMDRAREIATGFAANTSAMSVAINRQLIWRMMGAEHPMEAHAAESRTMYHTSTRDGKEGVQSFLDKRDPAFKDAVSQGAPIGFNWDAEPPFE
ncbi:MAG: crotonase/enoyl-CoA hydratase family protein [Kordiimonadaceae bacterium]|nr:crotonase/enoyl-CoA hydratase family protein [Kordiimonadaceae bacterium]MBO6568509.1 crotonase/enoyl-CoA hydratase family protein [Kordiimonadaceae bacterium]MBO6963762.1 crotonase/enoyl-CoA hydratase family protein [Kordiimonadaceae bacterium]